jgi:hypothetical protein
MLTPSDWTLAAQSATRWVVFFAAWIPLSVNCTKLMYVAMMFIPQAFSGSFFSNEVNPRVGLPTPNVKR